jgi:hypothetical protein
MQSDPAVPPPREALEHAHSFATLPPLMKRAICLIAVFPAAILAGCGGGGDSTPETPIVPKVKAPPKLSKADFIRQADGYCAELNAALGSVSSGTTQSNGVEPVADLYNGLLQHLRGLGTPDDQAGLDEFYNAGDDIVGAEESAKTAAANGDDAALASAQSDAASAQARFASAASAYGFQECGQGPTTPSSTTPSGAAPVTPAPAAPVTTTPTVPATPPGTTGAGGGTAGTGTGGGSTGTGTGGGTGGTSGGSGGVGPG